MRQGEDVTSRLYSLKLPTRAVKNLEFKAKQGVPFCAEKTTTMKNIPKEQQSSCLPPRASSEESVHFTEFINQRFNYNPRNITTPQENSGTTFISIRLLPTQATHGQLYKLMKTRIIMWRQTSWQSTIAKNLRKKIRWLYLLGLPFSTAPEFAAQSLSFETGGCVKPAPIISPERKTGDKKKKDSGNAGTNKVRYL